MEAENDNQNEFKEEGYFENRNSFQQHYLSHRSIDRFAFINRQPSIGKKSQSYLNFMDIQNIDMKRPDSDFVRDMLDDQKRRSQNIEEARQCSRNSLKSSLWRTSNQQRNSMGRFQEEPCMNECTFRQSDFDNGFHNCLCSDSCMGQKCPCYYASNQLCVSGMCCSQCIQVKNQFFHGSKSSETGGCLCKNAKCLKLYCRCYSKNLKCSKKCKCEGCQNNLDGLLNREKANQKNWKQNSRKNPSKQFQNHLNPSRKTIFGGTAKKAKGARKPQGIPKDFRDGNRICSQCVKHECRHNICQCFINQKTCTQSCSCQFSSNKFKQKDDSDDSESERKARYARHNEEEDNIQSEISSDENIEKYFYEEDYTFQDMNKKMEFEPFSYKR